MTRLEYKIDWLRYGWGKKDHFRLLLKNLNSSIILVNFSSTPRDNHYEGYQRALDTGAQNPTFQHFSFRVVASLPPGLNDNSTDRKQSKKQRMNEEKANVCFMRLKEGRRMEKLIGLYLTIKSSKSNNRPVGLFSFSLSGIRAQRWPLFTSANISTVFTWALSLPHITTCCYWSLSVFSPLFLSLSLTHMRPLFLNTTITKRK